MTDGDDWIASTADHAAEILDELGVDDDRARELVLDLADRQPDDHHDLPGTPRPVAAGAVYTGLTLSPGEKRTQAEVAEAAGLSPSTVAKIHRELCEREFPDRDDDDVDEDAARDWLGNARRWINTLSRGGR